MRRPADGELMLMASKASVRRGTEKGRFRSCVSWLGGPGRETALWGRSCDAGLSTDPAHERPAAVPAVSTTS